ncbi:hypothetical protein TPA0908_41540 [Micromonospora sp. AKA38]|nr:hypothetical protein TPA0908_41540 [Micromonospora sp. AKA38]
MRDAEPSGVVRDFSTPRRPAADFLVPTGTAGARRPRSGPPLADEGGVAMKIQIRRLEKIETTVICACSPCTDC